MKILHICNHFWPSRGGIEKFVLDLARESKKIGVEASVLCLNKAHHSPTALPSTDKIHGIPVQRVPFLNFKYYKPAWLPLKELEKADVLHVHGVSALLDFVVLTKWLHKKPIVVSTHGGIFHTKNISLLKTIYFFGWQKIVLRFVDRIVACSQNDFELFKPIANRTMLIENGVTLDWVKQCKGAKKKNVFLFVGRISKNKRLDKLLKAFSELHAKKINFELRIVGKDWEGIRQELQTLAKRRGIEKKVVFVGEVSEKQLVKEYCQAKFFVSASQYEGFGISAIEAMAAGCVVILNKIPAFKQFIKDNENGFLVDFLHAAAASQKICEILQKSQKRIMEEGQKTALQFSWSKRVERWKRVYEQVARKGKTASILFT